MDIKIDFERYDKYDWIKRVIVKAWIIGSEEEPMRGCSSMWHAMQTNLYSKLWLAARLCCSGSSSCQEQGQ